jgi:hypothetical protein
MTADWIFRYSARMFVGWIAVAALCAAEHHGTVTSAGLPLPGVTITMSQGDKKLVTTTDERGAYSFADLADGVWNLEIEMFGFAKIARDIGIAPNAPSPEWELKLLPLATLKEQLSPRPERTREAAAPPAEGAAGGFRRFANRPNFPGQGGAQQAGVQNPAVGGRPSLRQTGQVGTGPQNGFQRLGVNAAADSAAPNGDAEAANGDGFATAELNQNAVLSSGPALMINGSVSSGLDAPQRNDWFGFGPGGLQGLGFGPGSPGAPGGPGGPGGPAQALAQGGGSGPGGGPGLGGPGGPGGFGGAGGPGGFGGGRGGFGGPGGRGGRGGNFRGRDPNAFGNGRRNRRAQYNGNLAFSLDNSALDAKPFSLTGQDTPKAAYAHFRSTGTFGGPLKIPHLLTGQKTFFNINYQLSRSRNASIATGLVPTGAERAGDFSGTVNPLTGKPVVLPFPNNTIPKISDQASALLTLYPQPNFTGSNRYNYQVPLVGIGNQSNVNARVTQTINTKNQVNANFAYQQSDATSPNLFGFVDATSSTGYNTGVQWTYHFTAQLISNLNYRFSRLASETVPYFANPANFPDQARIAGSDPAPLFSGPPSLSFSSGFSGLSDANYALNHNTTHQIGENLLWVRNNHNLIFGADFRRLDFNQLSQQNPRGSFHFAGSFTGFDFADFLLGYPDTSSIAYGNADKYFRSSWADTFVTDDWRLNSRLSLNIGVRWDFQGPVTELYDRLVNLAIGPNFTSIAPVCDVPVSGCTPASQASYPSSLVRPNYHEIQPRIGMAWRPFAKDSTVIRAGYGIYYNTSVYQPLAAQMAQQSPLSFSVTQPNSPSKPYTLANAFLIPAINATAQTFAVDPNFQIGYLHYWQVSVQHNLPRSLVATLTYNGNKGLHQVQQFLPNSVPPGESASLYPSGYIYETSNGSSIYHAGSAQLQRRLRSGVSFGAIYTFSKAIDNAQGIGGRGGAGNALAQNWLDLAGERSVSSFNRTHTLNLNIQFSTGQGVRGGALVSGWKGALGKDWTFTTAIQVASGLPLTPVVLNRVAAGTGITGTVRADVTGLPVNSAPEGFFLNPAAFVAPPAGEWGNAGRNIITGPALFSVNASAGRVLRLGERRSLDLRFDATNVLNHVNFTSWNTSVGSAQFGLPTNAGGMRTLQATLRVRF